MKGRQGVCQVEISPTFGNLEVFRASRDRFSVGRGWLSMGSETDRKAAAGYFRLTVILAFLRNWVTYS